MLQYTVVNSPALGTLGTLAAQRGQSQWYEVLRMGRRSCCLLSAVLTQVPVTASPEPLLRLVLVDLLRPFACGRERG